MLLYKTFGVWLSLVERCVRDAEAAGSNPVTPIIKNTQNIWLLQSGVFIFYFIITFTFLNGFDKL